MSATKFSGNKNITTWFELFLQLSKIIDDDKGNIVIVLVKASLPGPIHPMSHRKKKHVWEDHVITYICVYILADTVLKYTCVYILAQGGISRIGISN